MEKKDSPILGFKKIVVFEPKQNWASCDFEILESIIEGSELVWDKVAHGNIKWDGCCNFEIGNDNSYAHICGVEQFEDFNVLLKYGYSLAREWFDNKKIYVDFDSPELPEIEADDYVKIIMEK